MGDLGWMTLIRVTRVVAVLEPPERWVLPPNPHVTLRGALGRGFMELSCVRPEGDCARCDRVQTCPVPGWYDPGRLGGAQPRPFSLWVANPGGTVVGPGQPLRVELVFVGPIPRPTLVVEAFCRMAAMGIGGPRVPFQVRRLWVQGDGAPADVVLEDRVVGVWPDPAGLARLARIPHEPSRALVFFASPVQLDRDRVPDSGTAIVTAAIGRVRALARSQGVSLPRRWPDPAGFEADEVILGFQEGSRYCRRTGTRMPLDGFVGLVRLGPRVADYVDLLAACEVLHLGKATSAGLGRVVVEWG